MLVLLVNKLGIYKASQVIWKVKFKSETSAANMFLRNSESSPGFLSKNLSLKRKIAINFNSRQNLEILSKLRISEPAEVSDQYINENTWFVN